MRSDRYFGIISVAMLALLFCAGSAFAVVTISNNPSACAIDDNGVVYGTWNAATSTCTLTQDIYGNALQMASDGMTLDCAGHQANIDYQNTNIYDYALTVSSNNNDVIENCNLNNAYNGISVSNSNNISFLNNFVNISTYGNGYYDTYYSGTNTNISIIGNTFIQTPDSFSGSGYGNGLYLQGPFDSTGTGYVIKSNTIVNFGWGVSMEDLTAPDMEGNSVYNVGGGEGYYLAFNPGMIVKGNAIRGRDQYDTSEGFSISASPGADIENNDANQLPVPGNTGYGIYSCPGCTIKNNSAENNFNGIILSGNLSGATVDGLSLNNNVDDFVFQLDSSGMACDMTIKNVNESSGNFLFATSAVKLNDGGKYADIILCGANKSTINNVNADTILLVNTNNAKVTNSVIGNPGSTSQGLSLLDSNYDLISNNTLQTDQYVGGGESDFTLLGSSYDNLTLNLVLGENVGLTMDSASSNNLFKSNNIVGCNNGITVGGNSNTFVSNSVTGGGIGIYMGGSNNKLTNNNATGNTEADITGYSETCTNTITGMTLTNGAKLAWANSKTNINGGNYALIYLCGANYSKISGVSAKNVYLQGTSNTVIKSSRIQGATIPYGAGLTIDSGSNMDTISGNVIGNTPFLGMQLSGSNNDVEGNLFANSSQYGLLASYGNSNKIIGNVVTGNAYYGISLSGSYDPYANVTYGGYDVVSMNLINNNFVGLDAEGPFSVVKSNTFDNNTRGVSVAGSAIGSKIEDNSVKNSKVFGITSFFVNDPVTYDGNIVTKSGSDGMYMAYGSNQKVSDNVVTNNAGYGISGDYDSADNFTGNTLKGNTLGGLYITGTGDALNKNSACNGAGTDITADATQNTGDKNTCSTVSGWKDASAKSGCLYTCKGR